MYGAGTYAATSSSQSGAQASAHVPFGGQNALGSATGVCWTSAPGYTAINGFAYLPATGASRSQVPTTVVDGTTYAGDWVQLTMTNGFVAAPGASYSIVPQLSTGTSGIPSGQPTCWVLAGSSDGGATWTTLDATYASTAYKPANAITSSTWPMTAATRAGAVVGAVRLIVTAVSVSANPGSSLLSASICAFSVTAPPAATTVSSGPGTTLATGMLGLGTAAPLQRLDVRGSAAITGSLGIGGGASASNPQYLLQLQRDSAAKPSTSTWTVFSDARLKERIEDCDLERCAEIVRSVPLRRFTWREDVHAADDVPDRSKLGFVAQEVQRAFPKAVAAQPAHGLEDCLSLNADQMMMALYGAVRHLLLKFDPPSSARAAEEETEKEKDDAIALE